MRWLYRLQQRLSLTGTEATAFLVAAAALVAGLIVREVQGNAAPPAVDLFAEARLAPPADSLVSAAATPTTLPREALDAGVRADSAGVDSSSAPEPRGRTRSASLPPVRMNLNTADVGLLDRLPGIGPALAGRIVEHRRTRGPFRSVDGVLDVRGIGPKKLERMRPYLFVD